LRRYVRRSPTPKGRCIVASDLDVAERLRAALDDRVLDIPLNQIQQAGRRRRRWDLVGVTSLLVAIALVGLTTWRLAGAGGATVAGFSALEVHGRDVIGVVKPSVDMLPTIRVGDVVAVDIDAYADEGPAVGDVVAFPFGASACSAMMVKRVVGLPGDTVEQREGRIYTNGDLVDGPRTGSRADGSSSIGPWVVEPSHVFVVGDNLDNSNDSRLSVGQVPINDLIGRADLSVSLDRFDVPPGPACAAPA
jgi:signal peptidase I